MSKLLKCATWNPGGTRALLVAQNMKIFDDYDVIALQETQALTPTYLPNPAAYTVFTKDAVSSGSNRRIGGVAIYFRDWLMNDFAPEQLEINLGIDSVFVLFRPRDSSRTPVLVASAYVPPDSDGNAYSGVYGVLGDEIDRISMSDPTMIVILLGDLNGHLPAPHPGPKKLSARDHVFVDFVDL